MGNDATSATPEELLAEIEWVRRLARALVGRGESDEVVQQTYVQALTNPPAAGTLRRWLRVVVRNVVRRRARDVATRAWHEHLAPTAAREPTPDETVARAELHRNVVDAVLALDEPYRRAVLLRFLEQKEVAEIARITESPEATVRTRIRRGVERVREALQTKAGLDSKDPAAAQALLFARLCDFASGGGVGGGAAAGTGAGASTGAAAEAATGAAVVAGGVVMSVAAKWTLAAAVAVAATISIWVATRPAGERPKIDAAKSASPPPQIAAAQAAPSMPPAPSVPDAARVPAPIAADPASSPPSGETPSPAAKVTNSGTLRGTVVDDATREPIAAADVWIIASRDPYDGLDEAARIAGEALADPKRALDRHAPVATATTADDGFFECDKLSAFSDWRAVAFDEKCRCAMSKPLRFDDEHATLEVELRLAPTVVLKGTVTDHDHTPIAGATIIVQVRKSKGGAAIMTVESQSGPSAGAWTTATLIGSSFDVSAMKNGYERPASPRHVDVAPGQREVDIDLVLETSTAVPVRGPIVDPAGTPIDLKSRLPELFGEASLDDCVRRHLSIQALRGATELPAVGSNPPNSSGRFDEVVPGIVVPDRNAYEMLVPQGFKGIVYLIADSCVAGAARIEDGTHLPSLPFETSGVVPPLPRATLVVGLIDEARDARVDVRRDEVTVVPAIPQTQGYDVARESTNPSGARVSEFDVYTGRVLVTFARRGFVTTTKELVVAEKGERRIVELPLVRASASIHGHVTVADVIFDGVARKPGVNVSVYAMSTQGFEAVTTMPVAVNDAGRFEITGLAPRDYAVVAESYGSTSAIAHTHAADPPPEIELEIGKGENVRFLVPRPAMTYGLADVMWRIVNAEGVPVLNWLHSHSQQSNQSGQLSATLAPGHYQALFWSRGCRELTREFDVPAPGPIEVRLERAR